MCYAHAPHQPYLAIGSMWGTGYALNLWPRGHTGEIRGYFLSISCLPVSPVNVCIPAPSDRDEAPGNTTDQTDHTTRLTMYRPEGV